MPQSYGFLLLFLLSFLGSGVSAKPSAKALLREACIIELVREQPADYTSKSFALRVQQLPPKPDDRLYFLDKYNGALAQQIDSYKTDRKAVGRYRGLMKVWYDWRLGRLQKKMGSAQPSQYAEELKKANGLLKPELWAKGTYDSSATEREALLQPLQKAIADYRDLLEAAEKIFNSGFLAYVNERILMETQAYGRPTREKPIEIANLPVLNPTDGSIQFQITREVFNSNIEIDKQIAENRKERKKKLGTLFSRGEFDALEYQHADLYKILDVYRSLFDKARRAGTLPEPLLLMLADIKKLLSEGLEPQPLASLMIAKKLYETEKARYESVQKGQNDYVFQLIKEQLQASLGTSPTDEQIAAEMQKLGLNKIDRVLDSIWTSSYKHVGSLIATVARSAALKWFLTLAGGSALGSVAFSQLDWNDVSGFVENTGQYIVDNGGNRFDSIFGYPMQVSSIAESDNYALDRAEFFMKNFKDVIMHKRDPTQPVKKSRLIEYEQLNRDIHLARWDYENEQKIKELKEKDKEKAIEDYKQITGSLVNDLQMHLLDTVYFATENDRSRSRAKLFLDYVKKLDATQEMPEKEAQDLEVWYRLGLPSGQLHPALTSVSRLEFIKKVVWYQNQFEKLNSEKPNASRADIINELLSMNGPN